jgi:DNA-binding NarL/FixJ family response regulator
MAGTAAALRKAIVTTPYRAHTGPGTIVSVGGGAAAARVLLVDDEELLAMALKLVLSDEFCVDAMTDAREALALLTSQTSGPAYDVVLCDVMMPAMNGVELRNRVHAVAPQQAARFIFVTGGICMPYVRALLESVPNACFEKPLDVSVLRETIRRCARSAEPPLRGLLSSLG